MTAYEVRISDWSSDVCSSDLGVLGATGEGLLVRTGDHGPGDRVVAHHQIGVAVAGGSRDRAGSERQTGDEAAPLSARPRDRLRLVPPCRHDGGAIVSGEATPDDRHVAPGDGVGAGRGGGGARMAEGDG